MSRYFCRAWLQAGTFVLACWVTGPISSAAGEKSNSPTQKTEATTDAEQQKFKLRKQFMMQACGKYEMQIGDAEQAAVAELLTEPVQRWNNVIATVADGVIVVYARRSRPDVVGQFHIHKNRFVVNEFSRVCEEPLRMNRNGRTVWNPSEKWTEFKLLPNAPTEIGSTPALHLAQMRRQAERFSIRDERDGKVETASILRLMPRPVYRYQDETNLIDGAMFLFVTGVDPQLALLMEISHSPEGQPVWFYALAPVTIYELTATLDESVVWHKPRVTQFGAYAYPYFAGPYQSDPEDLSVADLLSADSENK